MVEPPVSGFGFYFDCFSFEHLDILFWFRSFYTFDSDPAGERLLLEIRIDTGYRNLQYMRLVFYYLTALQYFYRFLTYIRTKLLKHSALWKKVRKNNEMRKEDTLSSCEKSLNYLPPFMPGFIVWYHKNGIKYLNIVIYAINSFAKRR